MTGFRPLAAAVVTAAVLVGCGSDDETTSTTSSASTPTGPAQTGKPVPPPRPKESIQEATERIAETVSSEDCTAINQLTALSRPYDACEGLQALGALPVEAAAAYGVGGAVIIYGSGESLRNAILILDSDGLYHLPVVDPFNIQPSVGTRFASEFDAAARDAVEALRARDCDAFKEVALARFGPGSTPDQVCTYLDESPLTQFLVAYPDAQPKRLGGNGDYAFYSVSSPEAYYTIVMARESTSGVVANAPPLPDGAPEYGFVDAYSTNPPIAAGSPAG